MNELLLLTLTLTLIGPGGGVAVTSASFTVDSCAIIHNANFKHSSVCGTGGGVYSHYGTSRISNTQVANNTAASAGGRIRLTLTLP